MSRTSAMVLGVSLMSFAAGASVGWVGSGAFAAATLAGETNPDEQFVRSFMQRFRERFDLSDEQARDLRAILLQYFNDKVRIATGASSEQWPIELRSQLVQAQRQMDGRIETILDERQRELYRREIQGQLGK